MGACHAVANTSMKHINPARLFALSEAEAPDWQYSLETSEKTHLLECDECQYRLEIFMGQAENALDDEIAGNSKW